MSVDRPLDTAIECLFDDLKDIKQLITEVRDTMRELLALLQGAGDQPPE